MGSEIARVGIIGAGQMGKGIAQVCAASGYTVALNDISDQRLAEAVADIDSTLQRQQERGQIDAAVRSAIVGRIGTSSSYDAFSDCDIDI